MSSIVQLLETHNGQNLNEADNIDNDAICLKENKIILYKNNINIKDKLIDNIIKMPNFNNYKKMISSIKSDHITNNIINESNNFIEEIIILSKITEFDLSIDENYILEFKYKGHIVKDEFLIDLDISEPNDYLLIKHFLASLYKYTNINNQLNYFEYNKAVNEIENSIIYLFLTPFTLDAIYSIFKLGYTDDLQQRTKELCSKFSSNNLLLLMAIKVKSRSIEEFIHNDLIKMYSELVSHITVTN